MLTTDRLTAHISMMAQYDPEYAAYARKWYGDLLRGYWIEA